MGPPPGTVVPASLVVTAAAGGDSRAQATPEDAEIIIPLAAGTSRVDTAGRQRGEGGGMERQDTQ